MKPKALPAPILASIKMQWEEEIPVTRIAHDHGVSRSVVERIINPSRAPRPGLTMREVRHVQQMRQAGLSQNEIARTLRRHPRVIAAVLRDSAPEPGR